MELLNAAGVLVGIAVAVIGQIRGWWESPAARARRETDRVAAENAREIHLAIIGDKGSTDATGAPIRDPKPGLVALQRADSKRLEKVEEAVVEFRHMTGLLTEVLKRTDVLEHKVSLLELAATERVASHLENAKLFDMVAKRDSDVIDGEAD